MTKLTDPINVTRHPRTGEATLDEEITYQVDGQSFTIPKGYSTDFATVPWWAQWLVPKFGLYDGPAVLHDFLYNTHGAPQAEADWIFYKAMRQAGVPFWRAVLMYLAVRVGGDKVYATSPQRWRKQQPELAAKILGDSDKDGGSA